MDPQRQTPTLLSIGVATAPISHYLVYKQAHVSRNLLTGFCVVGQEPRRRVASGRLSCWSLVNLDQADTHLSLLRSTSSCAVMCLS